MVQTDASSNDNMEKLAKEAQQLISEKEKKKKKNIGNSVIVVLMKRESSGLNQVMTQSYQRL